MCTPPAYTNIRLFTYTETHTHSHTHIYVLYMSVYIIVYTIYVWAYISKYFKSILWKNIKFSSYTKQVMIYLTVELLLPFKFACAKKYLGNLLFWRNALSSDALLLQN